MSLEWIAVDWGTSRLRTWGMSASNEAIWSANSDRGMGEVSPADFETALLETVGSYLTSPVPVVACGMVGSRQGWVEAGYRPVPAAPLGGSLTRASVTDPRLSEVAVIGGLSQGSPPDVMRGEETQIGGFLSINPDFDGVLCLPGTHSKWVRISAGEVVSFQTFLTGDLYAALSAHTILRHSIAAEGWDATAFAEAVGETLSRPERLAQKLFAIRAQGLLSGEAPARQRAALSGLLIGAELAGAKPYWLGQAVGVIGSGDVAKAYVDALALQGVQASVSPGDAMVLKGLAAARRTLARSAS